MTEEEIRMRSLELATRHALASGPISVIAGQVQEQAEQIVKWVKKTPATRADLDAYISEKPDEIVGLLDTFRVRFNLSRSEASYVAARTVAAVLECRKARP